MLENLQEASPSQAASFGKSIFPPLDRNNAPNARKVSNAHNATNGRNTRDAHMNAGGYNAPDAHQAPDTSNAPENLHRTSHDFVATGTNKLKYHIGKTKI